MLKISFRYLLAVFLLLPAILQANTLEISHQDLQLMAEQQFPINRKTPFALVSFDNPQVILAKNSNRLGISLDISAKFPGQLSTRGKGQVDGELEYRPEKGEFHLRNPRMVAVSLQGIAPEYNAMLQSLISEFARQSLPIIVVYRLDENQPEQALAKRMLKSVQIKNGKVIVKF